MKLSIITVNLNNRDGLKKTIDSVLSQTFRDFEWIVVDGGSTDGSRELIEEYSDHFSFWCSEPDKGTYNAMNKGGAYASGEYCLFLNSGDWFASDDVLSHVIPYLNEDDIVYGNWITISANNKETFVHAPKVMTLSFLYKCNICHQATFIRKELFQNTNYNESLKIFSDWEFNILQAIDGRRFKYIPVTVCVFSLGGISSTMLNTARSEKKQLENLYPKLFQEDFCQNEEIISHLGNTPFEEFNSLCKSHRLLAKIITATILLMKKL